jgi:hypothetical protein
MSEFVGLGSTPGAECIFTSSTSLIEVLVVFSQGFQVAEPMQLKSSLFGLHSWSVGGWFLAQVAPPFHHLVEFTRHLHMHFCFFRVHVDVAQKGRKRSSRVIKSSWP